MTDRIVWRRRLRPLSWVALLVAAVTGDRVTGALGAPDFELGRYLASECMTCHRTATAAGTIPDIFGMAEPSFTTLIKAYRDKQLPNPVMQNVASRLKDDEIEALAAYFAQTKRR
jgi:cytochrome c553